MEASDRRKARQVDRLIIEAGKYNSLTAGEHLPRREVIQQAKANGYTSTEARCLCDDLPETVEIPRQGDLLGELWPGNEASTEYPHPKETLIDGFRKWLKAKRQSAHPYPLEHNWSKQGTRRRFAQAKDVDRYFQQRFENFTTVMVTRHADENTEPILEQTRALTPNSYKATRRRLLKGLGVWDEYAAVVVLAPKYNLPQTNPTEVRTHVHECYWIPDIVTAADFYPLIEKHIAKVEGATADRHTTEDNRINGAAVTVEHHSSENYPNLSQQSAIDERRGATSALPYEILSNLPLKDVQTDASDLHDDRALAWCATMSAGTDDSREPHTSRGITTWKPLGRFTEYAETMESTYRRMAERDYYREIRSLNTTILTQL